VNKGKKKRLELIAPARKVGGIFSWHFQACTLARRKLEEGAWNMTHAREMLDTHPGTALMDADALIECIEACFDCAQTCTSCADACLGEGMVEHMRRCVTMCLNCSDVCATTGRVVTRQTEAEPAMVRAALQACAEACRLCGEECEHHATEMDMEHCRVCAEACRRCEEACNRALSAVGA
jgi:hypothetical protein